jgi:uncharacterized membrane protein (UPF0127 family)
MKSSWPSVVVVLCCSLVLGACSAKTAPPGPEASLVEAKVDSCEGGPSTPPPAPVFGSGSVLIDTKSGSHILNVEIAQTDEGRQYGLMFRRSLAMDQGMIFVFFGDTQGGFYMKNTYLPLSIAYFDVNGKILKIVDMDPCETDPTLYDPHVPYRGALEVNQGAFTRWGVAEGDTIHLIPREPGQ